MIIFGKEINTKKFIIIWIAVSCLFLVAGIFNINAWIDELFTMNMCKNSFIEIWGKTAADTHPPLYYWIAKLLTMPFGYSIQAFKVVSILGYLLTLLLALSIKNIYSDRVAIWYVVIASMLSSMIRRGIDIRMYSFCCFFVTLTAISLIAVLKTNKRVWSMVAVVSSLAAMGTHYYGLLSVFILWIGVLIYSMIKPEGRFRIRSLIISGVIIVAIYLPWMTNLVSQVSDVSEGDKLTIAGISFNDIGSYIAYFFHTGYTPISVVIAITIWAVLTVLVIHNASGKKSSVGDALLIACLLFTPLIGIAISVLVTPVFIAKYLSVLAGVFALLFAAQLDVIDLKDSTYIRRGMAVILIVEATLTLKDVYTDQYDSGLAELKNYLETCSAEQFVAEEWYTGATIEYLLNNEGIKVISPKEAAGEDTALLAYVNVENTNNIMSADMQVVEKKSIFSKYQSKKYEIIIVEK